MNHVMRVAVLLLASASVLSAQSKWDGTWKMNKEKSKVTGGTMTFAAAGDGAMKLSSANGSYTFKTDGTEVDTPFGSKDKWTKAGDNSLQHSWATNGQPGGEEKLTVSGDGKMLTSDAHGTRPNGEAWTSKTDYARVGGTGKGIAGTWKSSKADFQPTTMSMKVEGDTLHWDIPAEKAKWDGKMDGKPVAPTGTTIPDGLTLALTKSSANSFKMVEKLKDKPMYSGTYTLSADGKMMTVRGVNGQGKEPTTEIWEKE